MRQILHAHRNGKYVAIDNRDAVVVDYAAQMIRIGLDHWTTSRPSVWKFLALMLRSADHLQHYDAISAAIGSPKMHRSSVACVANGAEKIIECLEMTLETVDDVGYRLHTDPRSTLECCRTLAPGLPLPSRVRSIRNGRGGPLTTPAPLRKPSTRCSPR